MTEQLNGKHANAQELSETDLEDVHGGGLISADFEGTIQILATEHQPASTHRSRANGATLR